MKYLALTLSALVMTTLIASPAQAESRGRMVVLGDSISDEAFYAERGGDVTQMWWRQLSKAARLTTYAYTERGSGYIKTRKCVGTTIGQRINDPVVSRRLAKAAVVIIAAGVNDHRECYLGVDGKVHVRDVTNEALKAAVVQTMADLKARIGPKTRVIVTVPYGSLERYQANRNRIVSIVRSAAADHGFEFVSTHGRTLARGRTRDGIHPNRHGMKAMHRDLYWRTELVWSYPPRRDSSVGGLLTQVGVTRK